MLCARVEDTQHILYYYHPCYLFTRARARVCVCILCAGCAPPIFGCDKSEMTYICMFVVEREEPDHEVERLAALRLDGLSAAVGRGGLRWHLGAPAAAR